MRLSISLALVTLAGGAVSACHNATLSDPQAGCRSSVGATAMPATRPAGTVLTRADGLTGRPFGIAAGTGGVVFVTQQDGNSVARVSLATLSSTESIPVGVDPGDVVFNRSGTVAYVSGYQDGSVHVIDVASGKRLRQLNSATSNAYRLALAPDEKRLYVTSVDGAVYSMDPGGKEATLLVTLAGGLQGIALSRDGSSLLVSGLQGGVWRLDACTLSTQSTVALSSLTVPSAGQEILYSPDESEVYVANERGWIDVLSSQTLAVKRHFTVGALKPFGMAITGDGTRLYVTSPSTGSVAVIDAKSGEVLQLHAVGGVPRRVVMDAAGTTALVSNEGGWVDIIR